MPVDRRDLRRRLFVLASEQGGYFTAAQARRLGYSYQAQAHHVGAGNWYRVDRGVFRIAEWVPDLHDELARWTLWSGGRGVVSHESAMAVHDIGEFEPVRTHLTVPPAFRKREPAVILHYLDLTEVDVQQRRGFRVTTPVRSVIDVAADADADQLARGITEAVDHGLFTVRHLRTRAERVDLAAALRVERALQAREAS